jgi:hypothetical protein
MEAALADVHVDESPPDISAARGAYAGWLLRYPAFWAKYLAAALGITLAVNIPLLAVTVNLVNNKSYGELAGIEAVVFVLMALWAIRYVLRDFSSWYANEAFFRGYARDRHLELAGPLGFAAAHAEANLPFDPERVFSGDLPGGAHGALVLCGDGTSRESKIAIVTGPKGPVASSELRASASGLSAKDLDDFSARLSSELAGARR